MTGDTANLIVAGAAVAALVVLALAALVAVLSLRRMAADVSALAQSLKQTSAALNEELPPILGDLRATSASMVRLAQEVPPRVERVDALLDEADASLHSLRATVEAAEDIVRGPAAAVDRARRTVRAAGDGLARGTERLVRSVEERTGRSR